jgi:hypothetical protein
MFMWGLCTVVETMVSECALRIQSGIWEFVNNALSLNPDARSYFGTLLQSNGNLFQMLKPRPMWFAPTRFGHQSPVLQAPFAWSPAGRSSPTSPDPTVWTATWTCGCPGTRNPTTTPNWHQPTYVFSTKDRSQITGPTGTVADAVIRTVIDLEGSLLGNTLDPLLNPAGGNNGAPDGVFIAPNAGIDFVQPWAVLVAPDSGDKQGNVYDARSATTPRRAGSTSSADEAPSGSTT